MERQLQAYHEQMTSNRSEWHDGQHQVDKAWQVFEGAMRSHLVSKGVSACDREGRLTKDMERLGDSSPHWKTVRKRRHKSHAALIAHRAIAWLVLMHQWRRW